MRLAFTSSGCLGVLHTPHTLFVCWFSNVQFVHCQLMASAGAWNKQNNTGIDSSWVAISRIELPPRFDFHNSFFRLAIYMHVWIYVYAYSQSIMKQNKQNVIWIKIAWVILKALLTHIITHVWLWNRPITNWFSQFPFI